MQKWEYCKVARSMHGGFFVDATGLERVNISGERLIDMINLMAKDGWELVSPHKDESGFYYFKREFVERPE
ncbi:MAG: hypothetical protein AAGU05_05630 [Anaerolineaceae bacterium]